MKARKKPIEEIELKDFLKNNCKLDILTIKRTIKKY